MFATLHPFRAFLLRGLLAGGMTMAFAQVAAADQPDACKLLDPAAAEKILGSKITVKPVDTSLAGPDAASMCNYSTGTIHGGFMLLAARLHYGSLSQEVADEKKAIIDNKPPPSVKMPEPKVSDISGLGDAAFLVVMGNVLQIHAFADGGKIVINRNVQPTPEVIAQTEKLVRLALTRLH